MILTLLALLMINLSSASDFVSLGVVGIEEGANLRLGAQIGDYNYFSQHTDMFDLARYGYGAVNLSIGNGIGVSAYSRGGLALLSLPDNIDGFSPLVGLDLASIWARLDTNAASYYGWAPTISAGPQWGSGSTRVLGLVKVGAYVGNLNMNSFWPSFRLAFGGSVVLNNPQFNVNIDLLQFNENYIESNDFWLALSKDIRIGFHSETTGNIQSISITFKGDFL